MEGDDELDDMHQQGQVGYLGSVAIGQTLGTKSFFKVNPHNFMIFAKEFQIKKYICHLCTYKKPCLSPKTNQPQSCKRQ